MEVLEVLLGVLGALGSLLLLLLFLGYWILGYLAVPHTLWEGKVFWGTREAMSKLWGERVALGFFLGWLIIPWWLLKRRKENQ